MSDGVDQIVDRLAIIDVMNRQADLIDLKLWDRFDEVLAEDAVAQWSPEKILRGRDAIVEAIKWGSGPDEVGTYHHVANFTPVIHGDTAEAKVRIRAMHYGIGPRDGESYESLSWQNTHFVRTPDGWRIKSYDWDPVVRYGDLSVLGPR